MGSVVTTPSPLASAVSRIVKGCRQDSWLEALAVTAISGLSFGILMKLALVLLFGNSIAVCWPMVGLTTAAMLRLPRRLWPYVLAGAALGHIYLERIFPPAEMLVDTICDVIEMMVAAFALPAFTNLTEWIGQRNLLIRFVALPVLVGPIVTSFPVGFVFARVVNEPFRTAASRWFFADALGIVLWLPLGIVLLSPETYALFRLKAMPRTLAMIGLLLVTGGLIFEYKPLPVAFLIMPILLMVALKVGFSGSVIGLNALSLIAAVTTLHGHGPFGMMPDQYRIMALQVFLAACMLMCFPLSIIMLERDAFERELREALGRMEQLAINDGLTGLANRRQFDKVLEEEWRRSLREKRTVGLLMIDVDCFKLFNDCYGHVAGDECLRRIAESLARGGQRAGDLVGRYGGEEFFLLMPKTDLLGLLMVAERIRRGVELLEMEHRENPHRMVTISIGCCSMVPKANEKAETLVKAADQALYAAKQKGRNRVEAFEAHGPETLRAVVAKRA